MSTFYYLFLAYGLSNVVVFGKIFDKPRSWISKQSSFLKKLLECMMCISVWVGFLLSFFIWSPALHANLDNPIVDWHYGMFYPVALFLDGLFTSGCVWVIHTVQEMCERISPKKDTTHPQ